MTKDLNMLQRQSCPTTKYKINQTEVVTCSSKQSQPIAHCLPPLSASLRLFTFIYLLHLQ